MTLYRIRDFASNSSVRFLTIRDFPQISIYGHERTLTKYADPRNQIRERFENNDFADVIYTPPIILNHLQQNYTRNSYSYHIIIVKISHLFKNI